MAAVTTMVIPAVVPLQIASELEIRLGHLQHDRKPAHIPLGGV